MAAPVVRDQELELHIDSLAYGGNGVARLNGFVVFVRRGLPGDTVRARVTKVKRSHAEALATEVVEDEWHWRHADADGPNAPSHFRASLTSPQVLVPLRDGQLGLGTYQGIFFCEFDGPRDRKVYVAQLA